jgi:serine-type D-Ala-D-Ala carboxypeptidase (penicillin-binding protein 5/6)
VKTGHTLGAGYVLIGAAGSRRGPQVVSVVLGEPGESARDSDTLALLRWGLGQFRRVPALDADRVLARPEIKYRDERARLVARTDLNLVLHRGERIARRVDAPEELEGPIAAGTKVGSVTVSSNGKALRRVDVVTAAEVPGAGAPRIVVSTLGLPLTLLLVLAILGAGVLLAYRRRIRLRLVRNRAGAR